MKYDIFAAAMISLCVFSVFAFGWAFAHNEVSTECDRLGAFYVGNKTYTCVRR